MQIRTVLFDVDGTLLDTREFVLKAFEHTLRTSGLQVPPAADLAALVGPPLEQIYASLSSPATASLLVARHRAFQVENLHLATPFEGAADVLAQLCSLGYRLGAVTSRSRRTSTKTLELAGLDRYLEAVVSAEDAPALKPNRIHLDTALQMMGAEASGVAMVGDTSADIEGGRAIGALTVGALYGFHGRALLASRPDATIEAIGELPAVLMR